MSESTLMTALLAVQKQAPALTLGKDAEGQVGSHKYRYLTLDKLMEAVLPVLNDNGLVWVTLPCRDEGEPALGYRLIHAESSEAIEGAMPLMLAKGDPQGQGSAISYARRYSLMAVLGLVADDDDDAAAATRGPQAARANGNGGARVTAPPAQRTEATATAKQRGLILGKASEQGLSPIGLANIVNAAAEGEPRDFESPLEAEDWLRRALDRLPGRLVEPILNGIAVAEGAPR